VDLRTLKAQFAVEFLDLPAAAGVAGAGSSGALAAATRDSGKEGKSRNAISRKDVSE